MNVLAMVAHPDDEVLGAGGTLAKHAMNGDKVYIAYLTDGVGSRKVGIINGIRRMEMANKAAECLGATAKVIDSPDCLFPDNQLDSIPLLQVIRTVESYVAALQPEIIYTHHGGDLNIDHRICQQAVLTACRPMAGSSVKAIYAMEVPSSTEWNAPNTFQPNRFVDMAHLWDKKKEALQAYGIEMREYPHPRSFQAIYSLNRWRGATTGVEMAEAFMVLREIA